MGADSGEILSRVDGILFTKCILRTTLRSSELRSLTVTVLAVDVESGDIGGGVGAATCPSFFETKLVAKPLLAAKGFLVGFWRSLVPSMISSISWSFDIVGFAFDLKLTGA